MPGIYSTYNLIFAISVTAVERTQECSINKLEHFLSTICAARELAFNNFCRPLGEFYSNSCRTSNLADGLGIYLVLADVNSSLQAVWF